MALCVGTGWVLGALSGIDQLVPVLVFGSRQQLYISRRVLLPTVYRAQESLLPAGGSRFSCPYLMAGLIFIPSPTSLLHPCGWTHCHTTDLTCFP